MKLKVNAAWAGAEANKQQAAAVPPASRRESFSIMVFVVNMGVLSVT